MIELIVQKWGKSQGVKIPKHILDKMDIKIGDIMTCVIEGDKIILQKLITYKRKSKHKLEDLLVNIPKKQECEWGMQGRESW